MDPARRTGVGWVVRRKDFKWDLQDLHGGQRLALQDSTWQQCPSQISCHLSRLNRFNIRLQAP